MVDGGGDAAGLSNGLLKGHSGDQIIDSGIDVEVRVAVGVATEGKDNEAERRRRGLFRENTTYSEKGFDSQSTEGLARAMERTRRRQTIVFMLSFDTKESKEKWQAREVEIRR